MCVVCWLLLAGWSLIARRLATRSITQCRILMRRAPAAVLSTQYSRALLSLFNALRRLISDFALLGVIMCKQVVRARSIFCAIARKNFDWIK